MSVECWASRHAHRRLEDIAYLRLYYENPKVVANVHVSWLDPCKVRRVTMVGSQKMVVFDDLAAEERIRVHNKGVAQPETEGDLTQAPMSYRYGDVALPRLQRAAQHRGRALHRLHPDRDAPADRRRERSRRGRGAGGGTAVRPAATGRGPLRGARPRRPELTIPRQANRSASRGAVSRQDFAPAPAPVPFLDLSGMTADVREETAGGASCSTPAPSSGDGGGPLRAGLGRLLRDLPAVGVANGTDALHLTFRALGIGAGDEVVVPANTFVATAEAVVLAGARPASPTSTRTRC